MYDVNPLGPMMHLKELDRQATPRLRRLRTGWQNGFSLSGVKLSMIAFLRHLHAARFPWRTLREVSSQPPTTVVWELAHCVSSLRSSGSTGLRGKADVPRTWPYSRP